MILAAIGVGAFLLLNIVLGARLLLLARKTRGLPELVLGFGLFAMGGIATPLGAVAQAGFFSDETAGAVILIQGLVMTAGMAGFSQFTYRVFRPGQAWARWTALVLPGVTLASVLVNAHSTGWVGIPPEGRTLGNFLNQLASLAILGWAGWEAGRSARSLGRRMRLGLAEPVVVDRVRLWSLSMVIATGMTLIGFVGLLFGIDALHTAVGAAAVGFMGLVSGGALYLAFLPPSGYVRWVEERASAKA